MHVNLFFDGLSHGELLTFKTGPPYILVILLLENLFAIVDMVVLTFTT